MKNKLARWLFCLLLAAAVPVLAGPRIPVANQRRIARMLTRITAREVAGGWVRVERLETARSRVRIYASIGLSYYPFREENVRAMYDSVRAELPPEFRRAEIELYTDRRLIEDLIPAPYRSPGARGKVKPFTNRSERPLVTRLSAAWTPPGGLRGRHIALWHSHGRYFDQSRNRWRWQRARVWETCEDLYTQSYVLPFLVPMLENAGANVLLPRERDVRKAELIADNDRGIDRATGYAETVGARPWRDGGAGFAHLRTVYLSGENPFTEGTVRVAETVTSGPESAVCWTADVPEEGDYAVYVSYKSFSNSADDASYTVRHRGGESRFAVNQTMGGGTWIYLGHFPFAAGEGTACVTLTNRSARSGRVVSADAVKFGGGMGNMARTVCDSLRHPDSVYKTLPSGDPRFCEGARYWLQWAGFGEDIYSPKEHKDDYKDDYMCRALWVNALAGGSERLPGEPGLRIPVDMALAFHSDSGVREGDQTVGTLGIFFTRENEGRFEGGADRYLSRDLADVVQTQVVEDVRRTFEPAWTRRGLWNRSYYEARVPAVPTMLLELLSHQNFADMRYGHDPRFRFVVSRAVYKGILRHLSAQYGTPYVVQPLPVEGFSALFAGDTHVKLDWRPVLDSLEATAVPKGYVVYTRIDDGAFDNGRLVEDTSCVFPIEPGRLYSFRVTAVNDGGESFPSEILSVCRVPQERGRVLIVNGFDRVSGPPALQTDSLAGFCRDLDDGVPYLADISFAGAQRVFDRACLRAADERSMLGACDSLYETAVIAGNTFDYPALHGRAIADAGWSFCSAGVRAVEREGIPAAAYAVVDLILGKQRATTVGRNVRGAEFGVFTPALQEVLRDFNQHGGAIFVSGNYLASDLWTGEAASPVDRTFAGEVLHYAYAGSPGVHRGRASVVLSPAGFRGGDYRFETERTHERYAVESPDALRPAGEGAFAVLCYPGSGAVAGVVWAGEGAGRTIAVGFPFEAVVDPARRRCLMADVLRFLDMKQTYK